MTGVRGASNVSLKYIKKLELNNESALASKANKF
jgi:hypothetical protein